MSSISNYSSNATTPTVGEAQHYSNRGLIIVLSVLFLIALPFLLTTCWKYCQTGWNVIDRHRARLEQSQELQDRRVALQLQRQLQLELAEHHHTILQNSQIELQTELDEEERQRKYVEKRKDRRICYQEFLKPLTMVIKEDDFVKLQQEDEETAAHHASETESDERTLQHVLQLPTQLPDGSLSSRDVEPSCAICLAEYQVGDAIVWASEHECPHAFHQECMLNWLSTGKKRCPICRYSFVPKLHYEDFKKKQLPIAVPLGYDLEASSCPSVIVPIVGSVEHVTEEPSSISRIVSATPIDNVDDGSSGPRRGQHREQGNSRNV